LSRAWHLDHTFGDYLAARVVATSDPVLRDALLGAIGGSNDVTLAQRLSLGGAIGGEELPDLLEAMFDAEHAPRNWPWLRANIDSLLERVTPFGRSGLIYMTAGFCAQDDADAIAALFGFPARSDRRRTSRADQTLERIALCAALKREHRQQARELFP
jgi:hypothetical protein